MKTELRAIKRQKNIKPKSLRKEGNIPATLYGHNVEPVSLSVNLKEFTKAFKSAGESTIISLQIEEEDVMVERLVLIYYVDNDPVSNKVIHADFYQVKMDEKITASVPILFMGESGAVKNFKGILIKNIYEVEIEALPANLPREIEVDISALKTFDDTICIKDLKVPNGAEIIGNADDIIALVVEQGEDEAEKTAGPVDLSAIKTEGEEKREGKAVPDEEKK